MTQPANAQRWYPHFEDHETHEAFRVAFDRIYELHDQVQAQQAQPAAKHAEPKDDAGGPSTTKIAGLLVHAVPPNDGDRLTYNAATGEIIWKP